MFYILERAKCEEETEKYLEHVLDYCKKDYQKAFDKKKKDQLSNFSTEQSITKTIMLADCFMNIPSTVHS